MSRLRCRWIVVRSSVGIRIYVSFAYNWFMILELRSFHCNDLDK